MTFVAHQATRTPAYRQTADKTFSIGADAAEARVLAQARSYGPQVGAFMKQYIAIRRPPPGDGDFIADNALKMAAGAVPLLKAMGWTAIRVADDSAFIIADQPVFSIRSRSGEPQTVSEAIAGYLQMPLAPKCLLWMERLAAPDIEMVNRTYTATADVVERHNRLSLSTAKHSVYASNWSLAKWAADHRNDAPPTTLPDGRLLSDG